MGGGPVVVVVVVVVVVMVATTAEMVGRTHPVEGAVALPRRLPFVKGAPPLRVC